VIRVVLAGAAGRMGRLALATLEAADDIEVCGTLVRGTDAAAVLELAAPDVLLDFTLAPASRVLGPAAAERGIAPVIGTSGLLPEDVDALRNACARGRTGGLLVPNFSVGAVLQMRLAAEVARHLPCTGIHEVHHVGKKDAPSGTARATAAALATVTGAEPPITSERLPDALAEQTVSFGQPGESLELVHKVTDRCAYMAGVLLAVRRVRALQGLQVGLAGLLG
jgi:4-hydroxy-tetrahydrodipicolinate reductase